MQIKKKILALISCCVLILNLTITTINSYRREQLYLLANHFITGVVAGTAYTIPISAIPTVPITLYNSIKEMPSDLYEFLMILKKSINKSFKIVKWLGTGVTALLAWITVKGWDKTEEKGYHHSSDNQLMSTLLAIYMITVPGTISIVSLIGEKLTDDKE